MAFASEHDSYESLETAFEKSGLGSSVTLFLSGRGSLAAKLHHAEFDGMTVFGGQLSVPAVVRVANLARPCIAIRIGDWPEASPLRLGVEESSLELRLPGAEQFFAAPAGGAWAMLMVDAGVLADRFETLKSTKIDLSPAPPRFFAQPPADRARIAEAYGKLAEGRAAANSMLETAIGALDERGGNNSGARRRHLEILARLREAIEEKPADAWQISDICTLLNISNRTLHAVCLEHFGMGPKRYLTLRRLGHARRALSTAREGANVTELALRSGFWELGRFAGSYKLAFGESPSETLRRVAENRT